MSENLKNLENLREEKSMDFLKSKPGIQLLNSGFVSDLEFK